LGSVTDIADYLTTATGGTSAAEPIVLPPVDINLASDWADLLAAIQNAGRYVELDLSGCTMFGTEFDPVYTISTGKSYITGLVLPDDAKSIKGTLGVSYTFRHFTNLSEVSGRNVETVGDRAFTYTSNLVSVDFPAATTIGDEAFSDCTSLTTVNLPAATDIGDRAFANCTSLATVDLPASLTSIGGNAFDGCTSLTAFTVDPANTVYKHSGDKKMILTISGTLIAYPSATSTVIMTDEVTAVGQQVFAHNYGLISVHIPEAATIGDEAFSDCTALTTIDLPEAITIGDSAFSGCSALTTIELPEATAIGDSAFSGCYALTTVDLSAVTYIGQFAFHNTGNTALTVILGNTPPYVGTHMFHNVSSTKNVTVKAPSLSAYGPEPVNTAGNNWGNGFRGGGWAGGVMGSSMVNDNIHLTFTPY
jgi:hypothetical protein